MRIWKYFQVTTQTVGARQTENDIWTLSHIITLTKYRYLVDNRDMMLLPAFTETHKDVSVLESYDIKRLNLCCIRNSNLFPS